MLLEPINTVRGFNSTSACAIGPKSFTLIVGKGLTSFAFRLQG